MNLRVARCRGTTRRQQGFSLIEVLVAMLVLGVAVLAFAGLQVRALQGTGTAHTRSQAMTLAAEFVERVRANPDGLATYREEDRYLDAIPAGEPADWDAADPRCMFDVVNIEGCNAVNMAKFDAFEVRYLAAQLLPDGRLRLESCDGAANLDCVFVSWGGVDPEDCVDNTTENCVAMRVFVQ